MRTLKVSIGLVASVALLVAGLVVTRPQVALAQGDPHVGTWVLNVAKSKYSPGPPPEGTDIGVFRRWTGHQGCHQRDDPQTANRRRRTTRPTSMARITR